MIVPGPRRAWSGGAEDTRFELVRGCPQHAFQLFVRGFGEGRGRPDLGRSGRWQRFRTVPDEGE
jgi:hypothetical protein